MKPNWTRYILTLGFALSLASAAYGQEGFATIDFPGATNTQTWGINPSGDIVGFYANADKVNHGFVRSQGRFTSIDFPGASSTLVNGISTRGDMVAEYTLSGTLHGLLLSGARSTTIDFPGATGTEPIGISPSGDIVGDYVTADKVTHGFLLSGKKFTTIDFPNATLTIPQSINSNGDIVGGYRDAAGASHAFLLSNGKFTSLDFPGASFTTATGINPRGDVVGRYTVGGVNHGFVLHGGQYTTIDFPGATFTGATAINPRGDILGRAMIGGISHGFLMTRQAQYVVTDLGVVGGPPGQAFYVTNSGLVSGAAADSASVQHGFLWYAGTKIDISQPGLEGKNSLAFGVNTAGEAVGQAETAVTDPDGEDFCGFKALGLTSSGACKPFLWQYGTMNALPTLGGGNGAANMINRRGEVAGVAETTALDPTCPAPQVRQFKPVIWDQQGIHELPTFGNDRNGVAFAMNNNGAAVGASGDCAAFNQNYLVNLQPLHALLWETGRVTDLGNLGGTGRNGGNIALNMNNLDEVVGNSDLPGDTSFHAFLWTREKGIRDLGALPGDANSAGLAINDSGEIVGVSADADFNLRAYHWQDGEMTDLNTLTVNSPLFLLLACSINNQGEIAGLAVDEAGDLHAYLASPSYGATASSENQALSSLTALPGEVRKGLMNDLVRNRLAFRFAGIR
jgi:probable HAF family extracellular repeat protein